jgi:hypothetical protein
LGSLTAGEGVTGKCGRYPASLRDCAERTLPWSQPGFKSRPAHFQDSTTTSEARRERSERLGVANGVALSQRIVRILKIVPCGFESGSEASGASETTVVQIPASALLSTPTGERSEPRRETKSLLI